MSLSALKTVSADTFNSMINVKEYAQRSILERLLTEDMEEWARRACVELASASAALRRGSLIDADSSYRAVVDLFRKRGDTCSVEDVHLLVEANVGLAETHLSRQRLLPDSNFEKYWTLLKCLGYMRQAECAVSKLEDVGGVKSRLLLNSVQSKKKQVEELLQRTLSKALLGSRNGRRTRTSLHFSDRGFGLYSPSYGSRIESSINGSSSFPGPGLGLTRSSSFQKHVPVTPVREINFLDSLQKYCLNKSEGNSVEENQNAENRNKTFATKSKENMTINLENGSHDHDNSNGLADFNHVKNGTKLSIVDQIQASVQETMNNMKLRLGMTSTKNTWGVKEQRSSIKDLMANYKKKLEMMQSSLAQDVLHYEALEIAGHVKERQLLDAAEAAKSQTCSRAPLRKLHTIDNIHEHGSSSQQQQQHHQQQSWRRRRMSSESFDKSSMKLDLNEPRIHRYSRKRYEKQSKIVNEQEPDFISFEEVSPITEISRLGAIKDNVCDVSSPTSDADFMMQTLAQALTNLGKELFNKKSWENASFFFEQAISVYSKVQRDETVQYVLIPELLKFVGIIRCRLGNMYGGISLMQQAINLYSSKATVDTIEVASIWLEIGNAYLSEVGEPVRRSALVTLRNQLNREALHFDNIKADVNYESDDDDNLEDVYHVGAHEAKTCLQKCQELLDKDIEDDENTNDDRRSNFRVDVATRLGDCSLMIGDYDEALDHYERALELYSAAKTGVHLEGNAHVLCMLGMAALLLGNYSKAVSTFETAVIICKPLQRRRSNGSIGSGSLVFLWSLMSICYHHLRRYEKCIPLSMRCADTFQDQYGEDFLGLKEENEAWLVCETLYVIGNSYIHAQGDTDCALHYYHLGHKVLDLDVTGDSYQRVRLLKATGDVHNYRGETEQCLECYLLALDGHEELANENYGICFQQSQLCSLIAQQYLNLGNNSSAMEYMRRASAYQHSIHDDLYGNVITLQFELGMHALQNFQFESAHESFMAALHSSKQENGRLGAEVGPVLSRLATVAHVRAAMTGGHVHLYETNSYYMETLQHDCGDASSALKYANFLLQTGSSTDAIEYAQSALQMDVFVDDEIRFEKYEELTLRSPLDLQLVDVDEADFPLDAFGAYLLVACYRDLNLHEEAAEQLLRLLEERNDSPQNAFLAGAAMLEYGLLMEAAVCFSLSDLPISQEISYTCVLLLCAATAAALTMVLTVAELKLQLQNQKDKSESTC